MTVTRRSVLGLALAAGIGFVVPGYAQDTPDFSGKTIEWVIPFAEGGGSDVWARFFAPYLSRHLPGNPTVIIRNAPGGGSVSGTNDYAARAKADGSSLLGTSGSTQMPYLLGDPRVRYEYKDFVPLLVSPTSAVAYVPTSFGISDVSEIEKLRGQNMVFASMGATSLDLAFILAMSLLDIDVRYVFGMTGRADGRLALERGEATIDYQSASAYFSQVAPLVEQGDVMPLFSLGILNGEGKVQRDPSFPDIPHLVEVYEQIHGQPPSGLKYEAYLAVFGSGFAAQKLAVLPRETPEPIIAAYREAFAQAVQDPDLLRTQGDILGAYPQIVGDDLEAVYNTATSISEDAKAWLIEFLAETFDTRL